jgi:hypothetical protein
LSGVNQALTVPLRPSIHSLELLLQDGGGIVKKVKGKGQEVERCEANASIERDFYLEGGCDRTSYLNITKGSKRLSFALNFENLARVPNLDGHKIKALDTL